MSGRSSRCSRRVRLAPALFLGMMLTGAAPPAAAEPFDLSAGAFRTGVDVSSLALRDRIDGAAAELDSLRALGIDAIRLRLWVDPPTGEYSTAAVVRVAAAAKARGFALLLDPHWSDTWADPGQQRTPAAWSDLALPALADTLGAYLERTLAAFAAAGATPDLVQLGNEIDHGVLWPAGRLDASDGSRGRLVRLLLEAAAAVRRVAPDAALVLHVADPRTAVAVLDRLRPIPCDVFAVSYYPWWHGTADELEGALREISGRFGRPVLVAETAYPWTTGWRDGVHNPVGPDTELLPEYPASPEGQAAFRVDLERRLRSVPAVAGVFWWEPLWTAPGSPWENLAWRDEDGAWLPVARAGAPVSAAGR